jgi:hypothetical protein
MPDRVVDHAAECRSRSRVLVGVSRVEESMDSSAGADGGVRGDLPASHFVGVGRRRGSLKEDGGCSLHPFVVLRVVSPDADFRQCRVWLRCGVALANAIAPS